MTGEKKYWTSKPLNIENDEGHTHSHPGTHWASESLESAPTNDNMLREPPARAMDLRTE